MKITRVKSVWKRLKKRKLFPPALLRSLASSVSRTLICRSLFSFPPRNPNSKFCNRAYVTEPVPVKQRQVIPTLANIEHLGNHIRECSLIIESSPEESVNLRLFWDGCFYCVCVYYTHCVCFHTNASPNNWISKDVGWTCPKECIIFTERQSGLVETKVYLSLFQTMKLNEAKCFACFELLVL